MQQTNVRRVGGDSVESGLLATKVRIPPQPRSALSRVRLVDSLERDIPSYKLTLLAAPAGYGKTTVLTQWARSSSLPVAWLSLSEEDNDLERFFRCLLMAWDEIQPGVFESPLGVLLSSLLPDSVAVLSAFIDLANETREHTMFVLDDYHLIDEPSIHEALSYLLNHLPPSLHFVLASRAEPPLALARYRARQELLELGPAELHFQLDETGAFLTTLMGLELTDAALVRLHTQLEGWIAGLQLAALGLRRRPAAADGLLVSGRQRFIADYLRADVIAPLDEDVREFLLQTSILERLSSPLCDVVRGKAGSQELLEVLEREQLFLVALDEHREWYRYHRLFADFLRQELARRHAGDVADLHRRAARWYLANELPEPAFRHAVDGEDVELVLQIVERYIFVKLWSGEFNVVMGWLDSLPAEWYAEHPMLGLARTGPLALTGQIDACMRCLDDVQHALMSSKGEHVRWHLARVTAIRCTLACAFNDLAQAEILADQALRDLPQDDLSFRAEVYHALGDSYRRNGRWQEAREHYLKELSLVHEPAFRIRSAHVYGALADLDLRQGRLRDAAGNWDKALAAIQERENWGRLPLPVTGWVYVRMGELLYEWNELAEAWDHLALGLERAELGGDVSAMIAGYVSAARLRLTEGDIEAAAEYLARARPLVEQATLPDLAGRFDRCQLELWLAQDRLRAAVIWADETLPDSALEARPVDESADLAVARVLIVKGDMQSIERALALLGRLRGVADAEGRTGIMIEVLAFESLAHWQQGERVGAMTALERGLRLAEPEGYVRLFADLGLPIARLLQEARARNVMPDYVGKLIGAFDREHASSPAPGAMLPEPLTEREQQILELIAAGLRNPEIAAKLFISPQTVGKHAGNIYNKLGVHSRTEAANRARELGLLV